MLAISPASLLSFYRASQRPTVGTQRTVSRDQHPDTCDITSVGSMVARCFPGKLSAITGIQHPSVKKVGECWFALMAGRTDGEAGTADLHRACRNVRNPDPPRFSPEQIMRLENLIAHGRHGKAGSE